MDSKTNSQGLLESISAEIEAVHDVVFGNGVDPLTTWGNRTGDKVTFRALTTAQTFYDLGTNINK